VNVITSKVLPIPSIAPKIYFGLILKSSHGTLHPGSDWRLTNCINVSFPHQCGFFGIYFFIECYVGPCRCALVGIGETISKFKDYLYIFCDLLDRLCKWWRYVDWYVMLVLSSTILCIIVGNFSVITNTFLYFHKV